MIPNSKFLAWFTFLRVYYMTLASKESVETKTCHTLELIIMLFKLWVGRYNVKFSLYNCEHCFFFCSFLLFLMLD